jgi:hypothetical protein
MRQYDKGYALKKNLPSGDIDEWTGANEEKTKQKQETLSRRRVGVRRLKRRRRRIDRNVMEETTTSPRRVQRWNGPLFKSSGGIFKVGLSPALDEMPLLPALQFLAFDNCTVLRFVTLWLHYRRPSIEVLNWDTVTGITSKQSTQF